MLKSDTFTPDLDVPQLSWGDLSQLNIYTIWMLYYRVMISLCAHLKLFSLSLSNKRWKKKATTRWLRGDLRGGFDGNSIERDVRNRFLPLFTGNTPLQCQTLAVSAAIWLIIMRSCLGYLHISDGIKHLAWKDAVCTFLFIHYICAFKVLHR